MYIESNINNKNSDRTSYNFIVIYILQISLIMEFIFYNKVMSTQYA